MVTLAVEKQTTMMLGNTIFCISCGEKYMEKYMKEENEEEEVEEEKEEF